MVEQESHEFSAACQAFGSCFERGDQIVERFIENICQDSTFDVAPQAFDQVQAG